MLTKTSLVVALLTATVGCSGAVVNVGADPQDAGNGDGGSAADGSLPSGPLVILHVRATEAAFPQTDGFASQTARNEKIGISGLSLLTSPTDPSPLKVYEGPSVEAGLNDKDDTVVGRVSAKSLKGGTYSFARVPVTHVRYTVAGTYHASGLSAPGDFIDVVVFSDGTTLDGQTRNQGWFSATFTTAGMTFGPATGTNPIPSIDAGGFKLVTAGGQAYYEFAIAPLIVDPDVTKDVNVIFEVNTNLDFHWQDLPNTGYATNVFDVEMATYEPVKKFGANSFRIFYE
ncbi:MAG: hypothetical protein ABIP39_14350 [Polyangiaceae bacterium]